MMAIHKPTHVHKSCRGDVGKLLLQEGHDVEGKDDEGKLLL